MRRLLPTDLAWAARYLLLVPPSLRHMVCVSLCDRVHTADKIRKRLGDVPHSMEMGRLVNILRHKRVRQNRL